MLSDQFNLLVVNEFPYAVSHGFRRARDDKDSREVACNLYQLTVEFLSMVLVLDYLSYDERDSGLVEELENLLVRAPSTGTWLDWMQRILKHYRKANHTPIFGAVDRLFEKSFQRTLHGLLERRNRWAHSSVQFNLDDFRRGLFDFIERLRPLHKPSLFSPQAHGSEGQLRTYKARVLQGDNPNFAEVECRTSAGLDSAQVFIYTNTTGELLSLHPLILFTGCSLCGDNHYYHYSRPRKRKLVYTSIPGGHEYESSEAYEFLERLFRHAKPQRIRPRHFSIPGKFSGIPRSLRPGDSIGPYRIEELLKIGGQAQVYRVSDTRTKKDFALKLLPLEMTRDSVLLMRFEEEAHNLKRLVHPNVAALHDFGEDFGERYIVLDLAIGGTIGGQKCRDLSELKKPLAEEDIREIGAQVCEALQYVHSQGIIHRDLKPGNLVLSERRVLLTDFGISRARGDSSITLTGLPVGTPEYMSPEQVQQGDVDERSDLYALGCILYEMAVGRPPYRADTPLTTALYHVQATPPRIEDLNPRISKGLCNIIYKALQKSPASRYQNARRLFDDLRSINLDPAGPQVIDGEKTPQDAHQELRARERQMFKRRLILATVSCLIGGMLLALVVGPLYTGWTVRSLLADARAAWQSGPEAWPRVCELVSEIAALDPVSSGLRALRSDLFNQGSLVIETGDAAMRLRLHADPDENRELGTNYAPQVLSELDQDSFAPGQEVKVTAGHYTITVKSGAQRNVERTFPVCVTHVAYELVPDGWRFRGRLPPSTTYALRPTADTEEGPVERVLFAERLTIENLVVPDKIPRGFVWVPPGPFFRSQPDLSVASPLLKVESQQGSVHKQHEIVPDRLEKGLLMAQTETSVAEFEAWLDRFADAYGAVQHEDERLAVLDGLSALRKVKAAVSEVPLGLQKQYWRRRLQQQGRPEAAEKVAAIATAPELYDLVFEDERLAAVAKWNKYVADLKTVVAAQKKKRLPIRHVDRDVAETFARTHPLRAEDIRAWLATELKKPQPWFDAIAEVQRLGDDVKVEVLKKHSLLNQYTNLFYYHVFYAAQTPATRISSWIRTHGAPGKIKGREEEITQALANPEQWLFEPFGTEGARILRTAVQAYGVAIAYGRIDADKEHLLEWLKMNMRREENRRKRLAAVITEITVLDKSARAAWEFWRAMEDYAEASPWAPPAVMRRDNWRELIACGRSLGWGLPTVRQWEKAARGVDDRAYPWGQEPDDTVVLGAEPYSVASLGNLRDSSPYRIDLLGANVSEWVLIDFAPKAQGLNYRKAYLKGGSCLWDGTACNIGYLIGVERGFAGGFTGIRVIRELIEAQEVEYESE